MNKLMAIAAFCAALLIGSGSVLAAAAEPLSEDVAESSGSYYDPVVVKSGSLLLSEDGSSLSFTDSGSSLEPVSWELLSDGTFQVTGNGDMPYVSEYSPAPWQEDAAKIKKVVIGDAVTSISGYGFANCTNLTEVQIGDGVTSIGESAFAGCTNLAVIKMGSSINKIYRDAFKDTAWLEHQRQENPLVCVNSILLEGTGCKGDVVIPDSVNTIQAFAFEGNTAITSVVIPEGVTEITESAFEGCTGLKSVTLPKSAYDIQDRAFYGCTALTAITLPEKGENGYPGSVRTSAFEACSSLATVEIAGRWTSFNPSAFRDTPWLAKLREENPLVVVNNVILDASTCKGDVVVPEGVRSFDNSVFGGNTEITSVSLPRTFTNERTPALFSGCTGLSKIIFQNPLFNPEMMLISYGGPSFSGTIVSYDGSVAKQYAESKGLAFESLGVFVGGNYNNIIGRPSVSGRQ